MEIFLSRQDKQNKISQQDFYVMLADTKKFLSKGVR